MHEGKDSIIATQPLPVNMGSARWIACERSGRWAIAVRREPASQGVRIYETRSLDECWEMFAEHPASFVVAELTPAGAGSLLERLASLGHDFPSVRLAIVAGRSLSAWEELMRKAGAVWFCTSTRELGPLAAIARRHLDAAQAPQRTLVERIWAGLPWGSGD